MPPLRVLLVLAGLYVAQGLPFGFFNQALPVLMRQSGASLSAIGLTNLLALPWALKFVWAPVFDQPRWRGPAGRRRLVLVLQLLSILAILSVAAVDPTRRLLPVLVGVLVANLLAATQDIGTDAMAVETVPLGARGLANGLQVGGYRLGMVLGGGALLVVLGARGWTASTLLLAAALALATLPLVFVSPAPTPAPPVVPETLTEPPPRALPAWLAAPSARRWLGLVILYKAGDALGTAVVKPMLVDLGLGLADIGWLFGTLGSTAALVGAGVGGWLVSRLSVSRALPLFAALQALALLGWTLVAAWPGPLAWTACVALEHTFSAMATTALFTAMMAQCRPGHTAGDYTLQASAVVVAQGLASIVAGFSADRLGYAPHLAVATLLAVVVVPFTLRASPRAWAPA